MDGGEDVGGALDDALAGLGHGDRGAAGDEHRLVAAAQRQVGHEVALHQDHLRSRNKRARRIGFISSSLTLSLSQ